MTTHQHHEAPPCLRPYLGRRQSHVLYCTMQYNTIQYNASFESDSNNDENKDSDELNDKDVASENHLIIMLSCPRENAGNSAGNCFIRPESFTVPRLPRDSRTKLQKPISLRRSFLKKIKHLQPWTLHEPGLASVRSLPSHYLPVFSLVIQSLCLSRNLVFSKAVAEIKPYMHSTSRWV